MEICISAFRAFAIPLPPPPPHPLFRLCCLCCRVDRKVCTSSVVNSFGLNCTTNLSGFILSAVQDLLSTGHALHCTGRTVYWTCGPWSWGYARCCCFCCCCYDFALWRLSFKVGPPSTSSTVTVAVTTTAGWHGGGCSVVWVVHWIIHEGDGCMAATKSQTFPHSIYLGMLCHPIWICMGTREEDMQNEAKALAATPLLF